MKPSRLVAIMTAALGAAVTLAAPASAAEIPYGDRYFSIEQCLTAGQGGHVISTKCTSTDLAQRWSAPAIEGEAGNVNTVYQVMNVGSGQCLSSDAAGTISMATCDGEPADLWVRAPGALWQSKLTGLCLQNDESGRVFSNTCDFTYQTDAQRWYVISTGL